jgi:NAD(P)-dependent dehydrogenase (short-subunit alcohol dehydrogenase family)
MVTKSAALRSAEWDAPVNGICPGFVATQLVAGEWPWKVDEGEAARRLATGSERTADSQTLARMGEPEDVAAMALFRPPTTQPGSSPPPGWSTLV